MLNMCSQMPTTNIPRLTEFVHFNDKVPENKNIKIVNKNKPIVAVRQDNKWKSRKKKDVINNIFDEKIDMIDEHLRNSDNDAFKERFENFKNDDERVKESKESIELLIIDNSS
jgi:hypothetical protein